jgi:DNA-binding transcriptional regulator YhcF (GntR family)
MGDGGGRSYPYQQVATTIIRKIRSGELGAGDKLPSIRDIAAEHGITTATAQKVVRELTDRGYAETTPGIGVFVSTTVPEEAEQSGVDVAQLAADLSTLRRTVDELAARVSAIENDK